MSRIKKKAIILSVIGFVIGILIGLIISVITHSAEDKALSLGTHLFYIIAGGLHGAIAMGTSAIYEIESWSIARVTITHFGITLLSFYILGTIQGWLTIGDTMFWIITVAFILAYFIVWLVNYIAYKRAVAKMNEDLEKLKDK